MFSFQGSSSPTILIVDDNEINQRVLSNFLIKKMNFSGEIVTQFNGVDGFGKFVELYNKWHLEKEISFPLIILSDHDMGSYKQSGSCLFAAIRLYVFFQGGRQPILIGNTASIKENEIQFIKAGADSTIPKPVTAESLSGSLKKGMGAFQSRINLGECNYKTPKQFAEMSANEAFELAVKIFSNPVQNSFAPADLVNLVETCLISPSNLIDSFKSFSLSEATHSLFFPSEINSNPIFEKTTADNKENVGENTSKLIPKSATGFDPKKAN